MFYYWLGIAILSITSFLYKTTDIIDIIWLDIYLTPIMILLLIMKISENKIK
jgi:hypothetical protein